MIAIHMHFFRDMYAKLSRASGVLSVTPDTWVTSRQNEAREKSVQRGNQPAHKRRCSLKSQLLKPGAGVVVGEALGVVYWGLPITHNDW